MFSLTLSKWIIGSFAALLSAASFAVCSVLLQKISSRITPVGANFCKAIIGSFLVFIALLFTGIDFFSLKTFLILGLSGLLGISFGDTFFFKALVLLGPRLTLLLETLGPVFTVIMAVVFLKESPGSSVWFGMILTMTGIIWVLSERLPHDTLKNNWTSGIKYAVLFSVCMSISTIFIKIGVSEISSLQATFIRLIWASAALYSYGFLTKNIKKWITPFKEKELLKISLLALLIGIFGGFWMFTLSLKYIDASAAIILSSTTPIFILPIVAVLSKEKVSFRAILGAVITFTGIIFILLK